jgi:hypothetical protein
LPVSCSPRGILSGSIGTASDTNGQLLFLEQIRAHNQPIDIKAVAATDINTAGSVKIKIQALQNGKVFFSNNYLLPHLRKFRLPGLWEYEKQISIIFD